MWTILWLVVGLMAIMGLGFAALVAWVSHVDRITAGDVARTSIPLAAALLALVFALLRVVRVRTPRIVTNVLYGALALCAVVAYFEGFKFAYSKYYHRWEQYHAYVGARFFPELGYTRLYRCAVVAEDELGEVTYRGDDGAEHHLDLSAEVRKPDKKIRDVAGDELLMPVTDVLAHPEACKDHFTPLRWELFKSDVAFFRTQSDTRYWENMQTDHGFGMPPVWLVTGRFFASLHAASVGWQQLLCGLDLLYLLGVFVALGWAFGFRVSAVAAILWGCQAIAPFWWTGGAFLRQDWLFYLVLSVCLLRKRRFALAGAAMVTAALLRGFPGYVAIGWGIVGLAHFFRRRRVAPGHVRVLAGGLLAGVLLVGASFAVAGPDAWPRYHERAARADADPLTNTMGLRTVLAHEFLGGPTSGRAEYARNDALPDPFSVWKRMYNARADALYPVGWLVVLLFVAAFAAAVRRWRLAWIGASLAQVFIVLLARIICSNYPFLVLSAPLTRARRGLEVALFGFAALTQILSFTLTWYDDRYASLSLVTLLFCLGLMGAFVRLGGARGKPARHRKKKRARSPAADAVPPDAAVTDAPATAAAATDVA